MHLTKAEDQIMQILWKIEKGFVRDILEHFDEPKPAYTTVATIVKILEKKGFVEFKVYGNAHQFHPIVTKEEYSKTHVNNYFKNILRGPLKKWFRFLQTTTKFR